MPKKLCNFINLETLHQNLKTYSRRFWQSSEVYEIKVFDFTGKMKWVKCNKFGNLGLRSISGAVYWFVCLSWIIFSFIQRATLMVSLW